MCSGLYAFPTSSSSFRLEHWSRRCGRAGPKQRHIPRVERSTRTHAAPSQVVENSRTPRRSPPTSLQKKRTLSVDRENWVMRSNIGTVSPKMTALSPSTQLQKHLHTEWCSEIGSLTSLDAPEHACATQPNQQQSSSSSSNRFIEPRRFRPGNSGLLRVVVFNKTIAGRRRTLLLNVKPARMSVDNPTTLLTRSFFDETLCCKTFSTMNLRDHRYQW